MLLTIIAFKAFMNSGTLLRPSLICGGGGGGDGGGGDGEATC